MSVDASTDSDLSYRDYHATRPLKNKPGVRKKILERRAEKDVLQKELSDEEAKLIALSENLEREDLTPMEEARAFAEYVDVRINKALAEEMEKNGYETTTRGNERTIYYANFKDYIDFTNNVTDINNDIKTPGV